MRQRGLLWRSAVIGGYVGCALISSFVLGGGLIVLAFFGVWAGVWVAFSVAWRWADETRKVLLRRRGYY